MTIYDSANFTARAQAPPVGCYPIHVNETISTTVLGTTGNLLNLRAIDAGRTIIGVDFISTSADGDTDATPLLDTSLVIAEECNTPADAGTETELIDWTTTMQSAIATRAWTSLDHLVSSAYNGMGYLRFKVNVGAATAQAFVLKLIAWVL